MVEKIKKKVKTNLNNGMFHDSRGDINTLAEYCNMLTNKINSLIDELVEMRKEMREYMEKSEKGE